MAAGGVALPGQETLVSKLASALSDFNNSLASSRTGSLAQIWLPEPGDDGGIVLNTQGLPYSINGVGDLLALFRCISCKYKFSTDVAKPQQAGAVGRVFASGEPEMSNHVQRYDQHVYLRAAEAQRCRVHSTLFMPLYATPARSSCLGVFEVVLTDPDVNFAGMVGWIISCLQSQGLFTADVDTGSLGDQRLGLRHTGPDDGVSALESGVAPRLDGGRGMGEDGGVGSIVLPTVKREGVGGAPQAGADDAAGGDASGGSGDGGKAAAAAAHLQRLASGPPPQGMASPTPQQQQMAGGGSGSGGASGQLAAQAPSLLQGMMQPPQPPLQQQQPGGLLGNHRRTGSFEGQAGLLGSANGLANGLHGSGLHSASGGPSGSIAQQQQGSGIDPHAVAAAVAQLLHQNPGISGAAGAPQQLAALLGAQGMASPALGSGLNPAMFGGTPAAPPSLLNGMLGATPGVTAGLNGMAQPQQAGVGPVGGDVQQQQDPQQQQQDQQGGGEDDMDEETDEEDRPFLRPAPGAAQKYGQGNRILTYDDLAAQFGYGLKEAAARLNICPTTLKRACRRLGVPRWPRREIAKHKKKKQTQRVDGPSQQPGQQQQQHNGSIGAKGFSSGSGPSSAGTGGNAVTMLAAPAGGLIRPASVPSLNGLTGMETSGLPIPMPPSSMAPELAAALATALQQQQQPGMPPGMQPGVQGGMGPQQPNPALVNQVVALLQQQQQGGQPGQQQQAQQPGMLAPPGLPLPPRSLPLPPAPLLSNLGLPCKADSKFGASVGHAMGSLDILAAADFEMSVGNMSVGNSPRIALSNLGGLSNLGLSAFDFNGAVAGGNGPAATATGGAGGATGPQNGPAISSGAVSRPPADK